MKLFRFSTLLPIAGAIAAGALLFWTSQSVQREEDRLAALQKSAANERQSIRVLHAEWDYLNRPDRLEALAAEHLGLSSSDAAFAVSGGVEELPAIIVPALPSHKPLFTAQPAVMQMPSAPQPPAPPEPKQQDGQSFRQLLGELGGEEGEGAP